MGRCRWPEPAELESEMLGLVQSFFAPRCNPIGVELGTETLRLAQVQWTGQEYRLVAAASADVPSHVRNDLQGRIAFFAEAVRDLLLQGEFHGRHAVVGLPAACMCIQHMRLPKMDEQAMRKALPWEARGKLPFDPSQALLRHIVAGEVYADNEPCNEVIVMAAPRQAVDQLLAAAAKARLDVVGMNVEPRALVDCFAHVYRRQSDAEMTSCFVDIGASASRAIIARGTSIRFARVINIGGEHLNRAVADAMKIPTPDAKVLRIRLAGLQPALDERRDRREIAAAPAPELNEQALNSAFPLLGAGLHAAAPAAQTQAEQAVATAPATAPRIASAQASEDAEPPIDQAVLDQANRVDQACGELAAQIADELDLCRRYYESTFADKPVDRLIFVGGEARQRTLCRQVASQLGLAAQLGDPMVRMGRISQIGIESGIDRRQPQPTWAVAIGLSMGPPVAGPKR